jgi:hypothetical protein
MGAVITDETKRIYLMRNLNEKIFEQALVLWKGVLTRSTFPQTYDALKAYVTNEYSTQMMQPERAKVIYSVISTPAKEKVELSMQGKEKEKDGADDANKPKCHICNRTGHKMKQCWYYNAAKTLEQMKKMAQEKIKEKQEKKKKKREEKKNADASATKQEADQSGVVHKGTIVTLPPKQEKAGMCLIKQPRIDSCSGLYCEPCNAAGVRPGQIDFIYDSRTVNEVMGEKEMEILKNVAEEDMLIETVTGEKSISKLYGDTIFGKTRILNGRSGSVLVSQCATRDMYQVINLDEDRFILRGWDYNPLTKGKIWYFVRDEECYDDKLLHCTVTLDQAKCFAVTKESQFYDPKQVPQVESSKKMNDVVQVIHNRFGHASLNEMKNLMRQGIEEFAQITDDQLTVWQEERGAFCTGCLKGKLTEHARKRSTKPLLSDTPGDVTVGDIMFVETKNNVKKPLLVHVDVNTKLITSVPMTNRTEGECTKTILGIKNDYKNKGRILKSVVFDREPAVVPTEEALKEEGIELILKAAGQKVGLAELTICLIRNKGRATKAGVRAKYHYLPSNQFNIDL